jgi:acyl dehydratase
MSAWPNVGEVRVMRRRLTQADFDRFAALSGDDNPIHVDPAFAAKTRFKRTVAHGMLLYGVACAALGEHFPGAVQLSQTLMFPAPTFAGDELTVVLEPLEAQGNHIRVATTIRNPSGEAVCQGETRLRRA